MLFVEQEKQNHFAVQDELFELYGNQFKGIYFAPETAYRGERDIYTEKTLNSIYRDFCDRLKSLHPECEIVMSPATKYFEGKLDEIFEPLGREDKARESFMSIRVKSKFGRINRRVAFRIYAIKC